MTDDFTEYFEYLDDLRASGVTNMYGAGAYLEAEFGLDNEDADEILRDWLQSFTCVTLSH